MFQSLSGFLVRCNPNTRGRDKRWPNAVSIPIGFSGSLQLRAIVGELIESQSFNPYRVFWFAATFNANYILTKPLRFNPYRVFWFAATSNRDICFVSKDGFQSLSGFLVRCNRIVILRSTHCNRRFNPYRVFWFAATDAAKMSNFDHHGFQSLSGFLVRCNDQPETREHRPLRSFNPYRVFWFAATPMLHTFFASPALFQSLSGFLVRCNIKLTQTTAKYFIMFQSLSGFLVRCNQERPSC